MATTHVRCSCGRVELALDGPPILVAACYCDDCQRAGAELRALPGSAPAIDADGGTPYVLYRKDRAWVSRGAELLAGRQLKPDSPTRRNVATCCNSPMLVSFEGGPLHWVSVYRHRYATPPPLELRVQTRFAPGFVDPADGVPAYRTYPLRFVVKLIAARLAMLFRR